ncbi:MAG TPA: polysaccharide deacetylase family protein [Flavobacteriales bacterium]|nr:polysaccharide deacetylase family protein [Flavobacteriales bacterium]
MYVSKTPAVVKALYSSLVWNMPRNTNSVYLTFDDGPHPEITVEALTQLERYKAKGTFFCIGNNIEKFPHVFRQVAEKGHTIGNHTFNHVNGWKTNNREYYRNVLKCQALTNTKLFRPPYGKITREQTRVVSKRFDIIMWDVLAGDFDLRIGKEKCLDNVIKGIKPGSIVVMHDSEKAAEKMLYTLPRALDFIAEKGWKCEPLGDISNEI